MLPSNLALVDDDAAFTEYLADYLRHLGVAVDVFADSNDLLAHDGGFGYGFYLVDLMLPGIDGVDLIQILRRRSSAGLVVVSGRLAADTFARVMRAGADMYLAKPVQFEQVELAIRAVQRRAGAPALAGQAWVLLRDSRQLVAPDGTHVELSPADVALLACFADVDGQVVARERLQVAIGREDADQGLNATVYRLRRRVERATPLTMPLQSRSRVGYVFRAPLRMA
ncbi:response regulator transcription factor [Ideonella sp. DXS22W]|uniref:Response regulator transcription factor n=1 Tax=Pseudaquabacterium inlustre TaxID=2984192 RepID=A0ABU9CQW2_9BURK